MNTSEQKQGAVYAENKKFNTELGAGGGGLVHLGELISCSAIASQNLSACVWGAGQAITRDALLDSWISGESLSPFMMGLANDAAAEQGAADLRLAKAMANKLARRQKDDGRKVSTTTIDEGAAAAALAITSWRNGVLKVAAIAGDKTFSPASVVAWRACSAAMSDTGLGDSLELSAVSEGFLFGQGRDSEGNDIVKAGDLDGFALGLLHSIEPLAVACLAGFESRNDKAKRLLLERAQAKRKRELPAKMEHFKGAKFCKVESVERVERAASLLIEGSDIESASLAVGFKVQKSRMSAASQLAKSVRRLHLPFSLHPASASKDETGPRYRLTFPIVDHAPGRLWARGLQAERLADGCIDWLPCDAVAFVPRYAVHSLSSVCWSSLPPLRLGSFCGARCIAAASVRYAAKRRPNRYARRLGVDAVPPVVHLASLPPRMRQNLLGQALANFQPFKGYASAVCVPSVRNTYHQQAAAIAQWASGLQAVALADGSIDWLG